MTNDDVTEKKLIHKAQVERRAKLIRERFEDEELQDLKIKIRGYNRRSYVA